MHPAVAGFGVSKWLGLVLRVQVRIINMSCLREQRLMGKTIAFLAAAVLSVAFQVRGREVSVAGNATRGVQL